MYRLLLVDDETEIRNGLSRYFPWHELGFEIVHVCEDGKKALNYISANPVDVVLCDIRMPVMSGIDLARWIHENRLKVKVVFLSGYRDFEYAKQALVYNVKDYIVKPTKYSELYDVFYALKKELDAESRIPETGSSETAKPAPKNKIIEEVKAYVNENYREANLEEAARRVHLNPFYLSKYFKEHTGQNFTDYLVSVKMKKAAMLLMDFRYKTYDVSELVGYSSAKNFARTFKKYYGISPREFRNTQQESG